MKLNKNILKYQVAFKLHIGWDEDGVAFLILQEKHQLDLCFLWFYISCLKKYTI